MFAHVECLFNLQPPMFPNTQLHTPRKRGATQCCLRGSLKASSHRLVVLGFLMASCGTAPASSACSLLLRLGQDFHQLAGGNEGVVRQTRGSCRGRVESGLQRFAKFCCRRGSLVSPNRTYSKYPVVKVSALGDTAHFPVSWGPCRPKDTSVKMDMSRERRPCLHL